MKNALRVLDTLTDAATTRQKRLLELLRPADAKSTPDWFMCVPKCFNDSLDIRLTQRTVQGHISMAWTQGSAFSFRQGDILYDTEVAYENWSEALKTMSLGVQVTHAAAAKPTSDGDSRYAGSVTFELLVPDKSKSRLVAKESRTMSQDDFVRFLIAGGG